MTDTYILCPHRSPGGADGGASLLVGLCGGAITRKGELVLLVLSEECCWIYFIKIEV